MFGRKKNADDEFAGLYDQYEQHGQHGVDDHREPGDHHDAGIRLGEHTFAQDRRRRPWTTFLGCLLPLGFVALIVGGGYYGYQRIMEAIGSNTCKVRDDRFDYQWSPEQVANAATISLVGTDKLGLPSRASQIATATAIQESKLRNLRSGDRDSLGLFQQRPSMGWGTADQILDPVFASTSFYRSLQKVSNWQTRPLTEVAQDVQRSGFPEAYADHETQGRVLSTAFDGSFPEAVGCRLDAPTAAGSAGQVIAKLHNQSGLTGTQRSAKIVIVNTSSAAKAWGVGEWAVAHAQSENITSVIVGDRAWNRQRGKAGWSWTAASHPTGKDTVVRIELN